MTKQVIAMALFALLVSSPVRAFAHAHYDSSDPAAGASLSAPPSSVTIWFTEDIQPQDSWIHVLASDGTRVDRDDSMIPADNDQALTVSLRPGLGQGVYTVTWQNVAGDGDGLTGTFSFGIGASASTDMDEQGMDDADMDDYDHDHGGESDPTH